MKIVTAFVGDLSGSVGGVTASRARGGVAYFRFRKTPVNPNTARQITVRSATSLLSQLWRSDLSSSERDSWIFSVDGTPLQGLNAYIRANVPRIQAGLDRVDELTGVGPLIVSTVACAQTLGTGRNVTFTNTDTWATTDGGGLLIYETRPVPPSRTFENRQRFATVVLGDSGTPPTSPATFTTPWGNAASAGDELRFRGIVTLPDGRFADVPIAPDTAA